MQNLYLSTNMLDKRCYGNFALSEDILMENAAIAIKHFIEQNFKTTNSILIVCGAGNNGADGIALARMLIGSYPLKLYLAFKPKSKMAKLQWQRAQKVGVVVGQTIIKADVIVDAIFGSGFKGELPTETANIIEKLNSMPAYRIACDIPSGIDGQGDIKTSAFRANTTITMGAGKLCLYADNAKDYVGNIIVADLGVSAKVYQTQTVFQLLQKSDAKLPIRNKHNTHKGNYGHTVVIGGSQLGATILAAQAALKFGSGLTTIITNKDIVCFAPDIMSAKRLPRTTTAIVIGMGLGSLRSSIIKDITKAVLPVVIDADLFYKKEIISLLNLENIVLTPHPKEFTALLKQLNLADIDTHTLQAKRFHYAQHFTKHYPQIVLILKGANTIIAHKQKLFINPFGKNVLSKGGSGDILAGLIGSLISQNYSPLDAAITAVITHSLSANTYNGNNYALTPKDIIDNLDKVKVS